MYGYVRVYKEELKIKEYELYRGLYCSLCKSLGKEYGVASRLLLTYDVTFLVLVLVALSSVNPNFTQKRCPFNPAKRCNYCLTHEGIFSYAAAVTIILMYFKIKDDLSDGSFFRRIFCHLIFPYIRRKFKKASKKFPALALEVSVRMNQQQGVEKSNTADVDEASLNSAEALGLIFKELSSFPLLYNFGYALGRWVYLADAADDMKSDLKTKSFNVFLNKYQIENEADISEEILNSIEKELSLSIGVAAEYLSKLELKKMGAIIENVIFDGTKAVQTKILRGDG